MMKWSGCAEVEQTAGKVSGAWVFAGTRIPLAALYENLACSATIHEFVEWFPGVNEHQVRAVLTYEATSLKKGTDYLKVLFDQGTLAPLRGHLKDDVVDTLSEKGWSEKDNGSLLDLAEQDGYEVLVTTDQNLRFQQNTSNRSIGFVVLRATAWPRVQLQIETITDAITKVQPGEVIEVEIP